LGDIGADGKIVFVKRDVYDILDLGCSGTVQGWVLVNMLIKLQVPEITQYMLTF
jgi:hypothetical protein